ncbi:MAG: ThuA domain-containing protein, partial [Cyclobacteriaceae bacterium]|nr:ThuA domain-containing protein [Cyclobacteriaceae bacterium]
MKTNKTFVSKGIILLLILLSNLNLIAQENRDLNHQKKNHDYDVMKNPLRVLLFSGTGWYRHPDIPIINGWLVRLGIEHNMQIDVSETGKDISKEKLSRYDVLLFNNANVLDKIFDEDQRNAIEEWYKAGGGIVGLHALLVHQENWPWIMELGGCDFNSDSEFLKAKVLVDPEAMNHPTVKGMRKEFWYEADWTNHTRPVTGLPGLQVLLRVDESTYDP